MIVCDFSRFDALKQTLRVDGEFKEQMLISTPLLNHFKHLQNDSSLITDKTHLVAIEGEFYEPDVIPACGTSLFFEVELSESEEESYDSSVVKPEDNVFN